MLPLPVILSAKKFLPFIAQNWKPILVLGFLLFVGWKYHSMSTLIRLQETILYQDKLIIESHVKNEASLRGSISSQNTRIKKLHDDSNKQRKSVKQAQKKSYEVKREYDKLRLNLLSNKPANNASCQQNFEWMGKRIEDLKWKY